MQCDACRHEPVLYQPYSGKHLCRIHFIKDFETKAKHTIRLNGWLQPGNDIAVVMDGSAASAALLVFLTGLTAKRRDIRVFSITIDTGDSSCPAPHLAATVASACGAEWFCGTFVKRYGTTMDEIVRKNGSDAAGRICRVLSQDLIGEIAAEHGATRCAVATAVDECAHAFFSDLISGSVEKTLFPPGFLGKDNIHLIQPFIDIPHQEIVLYAALHRECAGCGVLPPGCCSGRDTGVQEAKTILETYDTRHPATKFALANLARTLAGIAAGKTPTSFCPKCGEPVTGNVCESCVIRCEFNPETRT